MRNSTFWFILSLLLFAPKALAVPLAIVAALLEMPFLSIVIVSYYFVEHNNRVVLGLPRHWVVCGAQLVALAGCTFMIYPSSLIAKVFLACVITEIAVSHFFLRLKEQAERA